MLFFSDIRYVQSTAKNSCTARTITKKGSAIGAVQEKINTNGRRCQRKMFSTSKLDLPKKRIIAINEKHRVIF